MLRTVITVKYFLVQSESQPFPNQPQILYEARKLLVPLFLLLHSQQRGRMNSRQHCGL